MKENCSEKKTIQKKSGVVRMVVGVVGSLAISVAAFWVMPKIQEGLKDKLYDKM